MCAVQNDELLEKDLIIYLGMYTNSLTGAQHALKAGAQQNITNPLNHMARCAIHMI
jgi:hypothetical protein